MVEMVVPSQVMLGERAVLECRCSVGIHHHSSSHHLQNHHNCKDRGNHKHKRTVLECMYRLSSSFCSPPHRHYHAQKRAVLKFRCRVVIAVLEAIKQIAIIYVRPKI